MNSEREMPSAEKTDRRWRRWNARLLAVLLLAGIVLAVRLTMLVGTTHEVLLAISQDIRTVSATAGSISRDVEGLRNQVVEMQEKVDGRECE